MNIGVFACQNCNANLTPLVLIHLTALALVSKEDRAEDTAVPVSDQSSICASTSALTFLVMLSEGLVVLSPYFCPFCEVVLRADSRKFALQADHFRAHTDLILNVLVVIERHFTPQLPELMRVSNVS